MNFSKHNCLPGRKVCNISYNSRRNLQTTHEEGNTMESDIPAIHNKKNKQVDKLFMRKMT